MELSCTELEHVTFCYNLKRDAQEKKMLNVPVCLCMVGIIMGNIFRNLKSFHSLDRECCTCTVHVTVHSQDLSLTQPYFAETLNSPQSQSSRKSWVFIHFHFLIQSPLTQFLHLHRKRNHEKRIFERKVHTRGQGKGEGCCSLLKPARRF